MQCAMEGGALSRVLHCNVSREGVRYGMQGAMEGSVPVFCTVMSPPPPRKNEEMDRRTADT
jgi:hypothetical protein